MFEWRIRYCDVRGVHRAVIAAPDQASALRILQVPPSCVLDIRRHLGLHLGGKLLRTRPPSLKLQLLLLTRVAALLASGEISQFNKVLQSLPTFRRLSAKHSDALRDDFSLSEKLAALHCADEVVIGIAAGEKTGTLPVALQNAIDHLKQSIELQESNSGTLFLGAILFVVSLAVFFILPSFLQEPLHMLMTTKGITVQTTPATTLLLAINSVTDHTVLLLLGLAALVFSLWFFRQRLSKWPPFHLIWHWQAIRRSLRFLGAWRPLRLANVPLATCMPVFTRALGAAHADAFFRRLQSGESLSTILKADCFSPTLAMSSRGLVEADNKTFSKMVGVLMAVLMEEQRVMSKRLSAFFYAAGIVFTIGVVLMVTFGLIFPILGATVAL